MSGTSKCITKMTIVSNFNVFVCRNKFTTADMTRSSNVLSLGFSFTEYHCFEKLKLIINLFYILF